MNHHILVLGGLGYIGSHVAKYIHISGYTPIVVDNLSTGYKHNNKWGHFIQGDIHDSILIREVIHEYNIESVIHLASDINVGESVQDPLKYYKNNLANSIDLLQAIQNTSIRNFILSSTAAVYGTPQYLPIDESHPTQPINPYGHSKLMLEQILDDYQKSNENFNYIALRYFNACGADVEGDTGEEHKPETHLIPNACLATLGINENLVIFGSDYNTYDGTAVRDYIHVTDLAQAHILALKYLEQAKTSHVINLGNNQGYSILDILTTIEQISGKKVPHIFADRRAGDPETLIASNGKAIKLLNWHPQHSDIHTIISTALKWHTSQKNTLPLIH